MRIIFSKIKLKELNSTMSTIQCISAINTSTPSILFHFNFQLIQSQRVIVCCVILNIMKNRLKMEKKNKKVHPHKKKK